MEKLDLAKQYRHYYRAKTTPELLDIEAARFLSISGKGDPADPGFADRVQALYATAYTIKFSAKASGHDFIVPKLEGLWWFDETRYPGRSMAEASLQVPRSEWEYRLLLRLPDYVGKPEVARGMDTTLARKSLERVRDIEYYTMTEGKAVQMLHIGPFSTEPETLARMAEFMQANKLDRNGLHHETYLSDFTKAAPEKLKTILREPVK